MPLYSQDPTVIAAFHGLRVAVRRPHHYKTGGQAISCHRLMVARVDPKATGAGAGPGKPAPGFQDNIMPDGVAIIVGAVALDVLKERAAQGNVEELMAAADSQHRQIALNGPTQEAKLMDIAPSIGPVGLGAPLFTVELGVYISAARKKQAIQPLKGVG